VPTNASLLLVHNNVLQGGLGELVGTVHLNHTETERERTLEQDTSNYSTGLLYVQSSSHRNFITNIVKCSNHQPR